MSGGFDDGDRDIEAAEYVLGTLDPAERARFAGRLAQDVRAQRSVADWELRFAGLSGKLDPVAPPATIWTQIERALSTSRTSGPPVLPVAYDLPVADNDNLRRSRNRWRTAALLSGAVAAALLVFAADRTLRVAPAAETYVAAVNRGGDKPALIVRVDMRTGKVLVRPVAAEAPSGKSLELWYIGADKTPRSMGLVDAASTDLALPPSKSSEPGTFAVSVEPPGGSKTGSPTGPVVYMGQLVKE